MAREPRKVGGRKRVTKKKRGTKPAPSTKLPEESSVDGQSSRYGRPPKYKPEFSAVAAALCKRGATDYELAEEFGVTTVTIWRWQTQHDDFCEALKVGKDTFDDRVVRSLAQRAVGYTFDTVKHFAFQGSVTAVNCVEHVPPDPGAAKLWLTNRQGWRSDRSEITGKDGKDLVPEAPMSNLDLARMIANVFRSVEEQPKSEA